jgi:hypothetical protein
MYHVHQNICWQYKPKRRALNKAHCDWHLVGCDNV